MWIRACTCVFLLFLTNVVHASEDKPKLRVGIVGAGISGATSSFFLTKHLSNYDLSIDLYESSSRLGGRLHDHIYDPTSNITIEQGASIIHGSNEYIKNITRMLGLAYGVPRTYGKQELGIWNGEQFVLETSAWELVTIYRMLERYGHFSLSHLSSAVRTVFHRFLSLYDIQRTGIGYKTVQSLLEQADLYHLTQITFEQYVGSYHFVNNSVLLHEFASILTRINYGQDVTTINALAGSVGLIPFIVNDLFVVYSGNARIVSKLLEYTHTHVHTQHQVTHVKEILPDHGGPPAYRVTVNDIKQKKEIHKDYDLVIIATPLESSGITFSRITHDNKTLSVDITIQKREFQQTHATFVVGRINPAFFNFFHLPQFIATPEYFTFTDSHTALPFTSIQILQTLSIEPEIHVYKVFSRTPLNDQQLDTLFEERDKDKTQRHPWSAYPRFDPPEQFASFQLMDGVFYTNTFENTASCLEVQAVGAMNVALLAKQAFDGVSAPLWPSSWSNPSCIPPPSPPTTTSMEDPPVLPCS